MLHLHLFRRKLERTWRSLVNFESRYGICFDFPSTSAEITFPRAERDRLIFVASLSLSPVAPNEMNISIMYEQVKAVSDALRFHHFLLSPVFPWRSLPAKSTRLSFPLRICWSPVIISTLIVKMEWDLELSAFISVAPTERFLQPRSTRLSHSSTLWTGWRERSVWISKSYFACIWADFDASC